MEPPNAVAAAGGRLRYALTWTVPSQSWRDLRSIELRVSFLYKRNLYTVPVPAT